MFPFYIKVQGFLKVTVVDRQGNEIVVYDDKNLIVDSGLTGLSNLLAQTVSPGSDYAVTILRAGDSSTAPATTQTGLQGTQVGPDKAFSVVTIDSGGTPGLTEFETSLATTEGNGQIIREVGLFFTNGNMLSRQVIGEINKTSAITVKFNWRIQFSR